MKKGAKPAPVDESISMEKISRKEAISRAGKYAAFTAASMMVILNPVKAQYPSSPDNPDLPPEWFY